MKSRPGSSDTEAYVFLISLFRTSISISTSTAITASSVTHRVDRACPASHQREPGIARASHSLSPFSCLGDGGGSECAARLPRRSGDEQTAGAGEQGDDGDRRLR